MKATNRKIDDNEVKHDLINERMNDRLNILEEEMRECHKKIWQEEKCSRRNLKRSMMTIPTRIT